MTDLIGASQAETMLRRVSPEGRALAARERRRRQRHSSRLVGRVMLLAIVAVAVLGLADAMLGTVPDWLLAVTATVFLAASAFTSYRARRQPASAAQLRTSPLTALPHAVASWLENRQQALPAPAAALTDGIATRLRELAPQFAQLDPREPAADAVRCLLAVELPDLIDRYQSVPPRLRSQGADSHLVNGLGIVDAEVARMTAELARGDVNALATRDRFLELKYQGDDIPRA